MNAFWTSQILSISSNSFLLTFTFTYTLTFNEWMPSEPARFFQSLPIASYKLLLLLTLSHQWMNSCEEGYLRRNRLILRLPSASELQPKFFPSLPSSRLPMSTYLLIYFLQRGRLMPRVLSKPTRCCGWISLVQTFISDHYYLYSHFQWGGGV